MKSRDKSIIWFVIIFVTYVDIVLDMFVALFQTVWNPINTAQNSWKSVSTSNSSTHQQAKQPAIIKMPSAETQADYEDFPIAEMEPERQENQDQDGDEDSSDDESRFDAAEAVSLIYKVEMEDKKGTDLPILWLNSEKFKNFHFQA